MKVNVKEPYAGQLFVLNEDNEFECEHELSVHTDSFSHDFYPNAVQQMIWVECDYGCDIPEHIEQAFIDNYYDGKDY